MITMNIRIERRNGVVTVDVNDSEYLRLEDRGRGMKVVSSATLPVDPADALEVVQAYVTALTMADIRDGSGTKATDADSSPSVPDESVSETEKPYTVLLLRPDYLADPFGQDTFCSFVYGKTAEEAIAAARAEVCESDETDTPEDYHCLFCTYGHVDDLSYRLECDQPEERPETGKLRCSLCGARVDVYALRDHLCLHNPNADTMEWAEARDMFKFADADD